MRKLLSVCCTAFGGVRGKWSNEYVFIGIHALRFAVNIKGVPTVFYLNQPLSSLSGDTWSQLHHARKYTRCGICVSDRKRTSDGWSYPWYFSGNPAFSNETFVITTFGSISDPRILPACCRQRLLAQSQLRELFALHSSVPSSRADNNINTFHSSIYNGYLTARTLRSHN